MHLGHYVQDQLDRPMIIWDGYCPTHSRIRDVDILREKEDHPREDYGASRMSSIDSIHRRLSTLYRADDRAC